MMLVMMTMMMMMVVVYLVCDDVVVVVIVMIVGVVSKVLRVVVVSSSRQIEYFQFDVARLQTHYFTLTRVDAGEVPPRDLDAVLHAVKVVTRSIRVS